MLSHGFLSDLLRPIVPRRLPILECIVLRLDFTHRRLNHPLIKLMLEPIGHVPDVFPDFVSLKEFVMVKEMDAVEVQLFLEVEGHDRIERHDLLGNYLGTSCLSARSCVSLMALFI